MDASTTLTRRRHGLEARRPFQEPVGAWYTHVGGLHTVFHIWAYPSMEQREKTRAAAWQVEVRPRKLFATDAQAWSNTVNKVRARCRTALTPDRNDDRQDALADHEAAQAALVAAAT